MDTFQRHDNEFYLKRQARRESNARSYPRRFPLALKSASGCMVTDVEGRTYIDCLAGAGTLALGHNHPEVISSLQEVLTSGLPLHTLDLVTPVKDKFVSDIYETLPAGLREQAKIQFCSPSGSDAVEAAIKLAKTATGRTDIVAFRGAYHGMSQGSLSLMGSLGPKVDVGQLMPGTHFLPYPYAYRCPFGRGGAETATLAADYFESAMRDPEGGVNLPAAVILEAVQGEGGVIPAPVEWLRRVRAVTRELGIPLILDEVQSGVGRTGTFYAFQKADIVPDIIILSKAIGGGLPMAVMIYREGLDLWKPGAHAGTFRGNQLAMAAGSKTLEIIKRDGLVERAAIAGRRLRANLERIRMQTPYIGDVRGEGLMLGVEMIDPTRKPDSAGQPPHGGDMARAVQSEAFRAGLILETGGRHGSVLRFLPPLTISDAEIDQVSNILSDTFSRLGRDAA
ncbi:Diaminobutyrate-2-oxoglutarateaminotransferase [Agrobacterium rosae]|uniref:Diaminobutyrate--2-oxoglutarate transaminase n=1 Tax=Agrobacterium rosae TaxID=1972867 RepID=A0A1R3U499_9HYPH|nr:aminotransferase class III-fold pyridoxal phosphate-dependent enzyme [Agrobacterium rosae]KAA3512843.1 aminotransferase class III-fold pyridoxal phosphate-dependent enzyme [Agrobacterium rosae]MCM2436180.1 diaminobutyrate--2-oxoglutarate transaminase [Agrobacterium rosae]MQB51178.1 aminotransferase class III-fold pyridoxal phosphate-dependent enzyme [Agrobacterium rosae]POO49064.1 diaminobutyrate--2-oxoglutarate transaminase [Agrobacterium rosae]